jgi:raffinose/stachyose/melibiose transport system substrate-binding protein
MRKSYRLTAFAAILALVAVLSFGVAAAQDAVTIHWWHIDTGDPGLSFWQSRADAYTAEHPNVTFDITVLENEAFKARLVTVMQAGDPPDLFQSWGGAVLWNYANAGLTRNIAPELTANDNEWKDTFAAVSALELFGQNGEYYGVPRDWGGVGMFYNKALFTKAGLDPDKPPATWTELLDTIQKLKDAGITPLSIGEKDKWPGHFWYGYLATREGGQDAFLKAYNREGSFADEPFVKAFADLKQLVDLDAFQEGFLAATYGDQETTFGNAEAAMELMGQWSPNVSKSNSASGEGIGDDLGWFPFPVIEGGAGNPGDVFGGGDGFSVGKNAPDEAVDFLKFVTNAENQRAGIEVSCCYQPPTVKGIEDTYESDPILSAIVDARNNAPYFQLYYDQFLPPNLGGAILDAVESVFAGAATPEEAAQAVEDVAAMELTGS